MESFKAELEKGKILLFDGAMGTELYNRGIFLNRCFEEANLSTPQLVQEIHKEYANAGAQILTTNSWGANRYKLKEYNLDDKFELINQKAVEIAKDVAGDKAYVAGSVGPLGVRIEPFGPTSFEEARGLFKEQIAVLLKSRVDLISFETFIDIHELLQAVLACKEVDVSVPIVAQVSITTEGNSPLGTPALKMLQDLQEAGVDAVGLNCSVGPQPMLSCLEKIKSLIKKPLCVQPNAGLPKGHEGRQIYMSTPEYMAHYAKEFLQAGVQLVGGCCGTSPEHIKSMKNAIRYSEAMRFTQEKKISSTVEVSETVEEKERVPLKEKSKWSEKIAQGECVRSVELLPPPGADPSLIIKRSKYVKSAGVDAINIPDGPRASARMSAILTAVMIEQQADIETVLHYTCRDRNLLGMQSDMLGAQAIGLRNMLLITGDPPKLGSYPNATGVFDVDAIGLTNMVHRLNGAIDLGGRSIGEVASLSIGVGVNPVHHDMDLEMRRFAWKVEAGAEWAITQPVFDTNSLFDFLENIDKMNAKIPIIVGAWPLLSYRNAMFMNNEVPGIVIPEKIIERMSKAKDASESQKIGVEVAQDIVEKLSNHVEGFQVSAPFGKVDLALEVMGLEKVSESAELSV